MVQGKLGVGHEVSNVRTSKTAWLPEGLHPLLNRLSRRIGLITGLKTDPIRDEAELLQVWIEIEFFIGSLQIVYLTLIPFFIILFLITDD
jgi:hypothetical protein